MGSIDGRSVVSPDVCNTMESIETQRPEVKIDGLKPSTVYSVFIAAETKAGLGPMSDSLAVSTLESGTCACVCMCVCVCVCVTVCVCVCVYAVRVL